MGLNMEIRWVDLPSTVRLNLWVEAESHAIEWTWLDTELKTFNAHTQSSSIIFESEANYAMFLLKWG
jgi:hypothetical protein